jgi:hypothetical protein
MQVLNVAASQAPITLITRNHGDFKKQAIQSPSGSYR